MILWRFTDPGDGRFAQGGRRGSWVGSSQDGVCPQCTASRERRARPLIMEWEPGSEVIGDFVWVGFDSEVVVTDRVMSELLARFRGFQRGAVEMVDRHQRSGRRSQAKVSLPYGGPALSEMWITAWVDIDETHSTASLQSTCDRCGTQQWSLDGAEHWDTRFDLARGELIRQRVPRTQHGGLVVRAGDLQTDVVRIRQLPAWVFCTSTVRAFILEQGYSNVGFLEMGETVDATV